MIVFSINQQAIISQNETKIKPNPLNLMLDLRQSRTKTNQKNELKTGKERKKENVCSLLKRKSFKEN